MIRKILILLALALAFNLLILVFIGASHRLVFGLNPVVNVLLLVLILLVGIPSLVFLIRFFRRYFQNGTTVSPAVLFLFGAVTLAIAGLFVDINWSNAALDIRLHDIYFLASGHSLWSILQNRYFLASTFLAFAAFYGLYPTVVARKLNIHLGQMHFWTMFIGSQLICWQAYYGGLAGMPRRYTSYGIPIFGHEIMVNGYTARAGMIILIAQVFFFANLFYSTKNKSNLSGPSNG